ncbi:nucleotidyl transferase AbiEii/AbiGii toxin family protein [Devosia sp.]|uniref:nucleotidyl transferase AbiEii/AbiGii toxin family protein n=1 Tax=Devosia sp. TaxID=1871048 RepID=UPI002EEAAD85
MTFQRPKHALIAKALQSMDSAFLDRSKCFLGGGTAIVLENGEYRLSLDVDFLCADVDGYRELRNAIDREGHQAIFGPKVEILREFIGDQYGIRGFVTVDEQPIKFEILREARIPLEGALSERLGVPLLSVDCQFAEKLLANADRRLDKSVAYRDAIDLGYLVQGSGNLPEAAISAAEKAYGDLIPKAVMQALERLAKPAEAEYAAATLQMELRDVMKSAAALRDAAATAWPHWTFAPIAVP